MSEITSDRRFTRDRLIAGGGVALVGSLVGAGAAAEPGAAALTPVKNDFLVYDGVTYSPLSMGIYNVKNYGAKGDGTDDTDAFEAAIDAASSEDGATLYIPTAANYYSIRRTLVIEPPGATGQMKLNVRSLGRFAKIQWEGGNDSSVFKIYGLKDSTIEGVNVSVHGGSRSGIVVFDQTDKSPNLGSTGLVTYNNCHVEFGQAGVPPSSCIGFRLGHEGTTDVSFVLFKQCVVTSYFSPNGNIGWSAENQNVLANTLISCAGSYLAKMFTNVPSAGAANPLGGNTHFFYGCGASRNALDFEIFLPGTYLISGGRWEDGNQFLRTPGFGGPVEVTLDTVAINGYAPTGEQLIVNDGCPMSLFIRNCDIHGGFLHPGPYTKDFITMNCWPGLVSALFVEGGGISATDPFYTLVPPQRFRVAVEGTHKLNADNVTTGFFVNPSEVGQRDLLVNGGMELWRRSSSAATHTGTAGGNTEFTNADAWRVHAYSGDVLIVEPDSADTASALSTRSMKVTCTRSSDPRIIQDVQDYKALRGRRLMFRVWVKAFATNACWLGIHDGVGATYGTHANTGTGWELISVERLVDSAATQVRLYIMLGASGVYRFDNADLAVGHLGPDVPFYPRNPAVEKERANQFYPRVVTKAASDTLSLLDSTILADAASGAITLTLPAPSSEATFTIKRINTNANTVTIARSGSALIDGATSRVLANPFDFVNLISDGTNWIVV